MNNAVINTFFTQNYNKLVNISKDYSKKYQYNLLEPDEIVSELYLYTLNKIERQNKLEELICLTAATVNYAYSTKAMYYIINIIYRLTHGKRTFADNCNRKNINIVYFPVIFNLESVEDEIKEYDHFTREDVRDAAKSISVGENWYKYKIWTDYYENGMAYRELSEKYNLTISPLYYQIRDFNKQIRQELIKSETMLTLKQI